MDMERLKFLGEKAVYLGSVIKDVMSTPEGEVNYLDVLSQASGLAGYACHQAAKANHEPFVVIGTNTGKNYYFGDSVNRYLLEDQLSVVALMYGAFQHMCPNGTVDINGMVGKIASVMGNEDYRIWGKIPPENAYLHSKACWDGIFEVTIDQYCNSPSEWPVLCGIMLQNILFEIMNVTTWEPDEVFNAALEMVLYVSKMDEDSI